MALYKINPDTSFLNYALRWGEYHKWGLQGGVRTRDGNSQCCGQTYIDLYLMDKSKAERISDIKASVDNMIASDKIDDWYWIDAFQMAMPVFAQLGSTYNDNRYYDKMYQMYIYTKTKHGDHGLYNPKDHLWWRDKDYDPPYAEPNGKGCYWSRGNGWVLAALVRSMDFMPGKSTYKKEFKTTYKEMVDALVKCQRPDGFWNVSLLDSTDYGGKELTGTSLFVYGIAWGISNGTLNRKKYLPVAEKAWKALVEDCVHPDGFLGYVQGTGKQPSDSQPVTYDSVPNFEDFGLGCFLLAGSEMYKIK
jgi:unsaturated rhamnogalacturonyl hydrolase